MIENFSDHPKTLSEIRSDKSESALDWEPRDLLISLLRDIDSGKLNIKECILCYRGDYINNGKPEPYISWSMAKIKMAEAVGLLEIIKHILLRAF